MAKPLWSCAALGALIALGACGDATNTSKTDIDPVNVVDASDLNDIMLTTADPNQAVNYFNNALAKDKDRLEFKRGLAKSLLRARRVTEAVPAYEKVLQDEGSTHQDRIDYADALIRSGDWKAAEKQLNQVPPTIETFQRYRLEALIADYNKKWKKADSFYEIASGLTQTPAKVLNNWGYSKLTRGDYKGAETLFIEAITYDPKLFTSKNNLVLARAAQQNFALPVVPMTEEERAQLIYTAALSAIKQGQTDVGRGLLQDAIDAHPRHFAEAVRSLEALNNQSG